MGENWSAPCAWSEADLVLTDVELVLLCREGVADGFCILAGRLGRVLFEGALLSASCVVAKETVSSSSSYAASASSASGDSSLSGCAVFESLESLRFVFEVVGSG